MNLFLFLTANSDNVIYSWQSLENIEINLDLESFGKAKKRHVKDNISFRLLKILSWIVLDLEILRFVQTTNRYYKPWKINF